MSWSNRLALAFGLLAASVAVAGVSKQAGVADAVVTAEDYPAKLSEYAFFTNLAKRTPALRVTPYHLNTPLFSDYTEKERLVYLPTGATAKYNNEGVFDFPVGTALIKSFGYAKGAAFKPIETRLLLKRASGWVAIPYVWDADGKDASLKRSGTRVPVSFTDPKGRTRQISYSVPNQNQCKGCHAVAGVIQPIGPKARNLNDGTQLGRWQAAGILDHAPADAPRLARWDDTSAPIEARATAYLEVNCAHCHSAKGPASNSGLFFDWKQRDPVARGIGKRPVAAGRGSGGFDFSIDPGHPEKSIMLYRMQSTEPGIAMPELGRATAHDEGIAMLSEWIGGMKATRN